jgi:ASC-1-like (ASCH) protein
MRTNQLLIQEVQEAVGTDPFWQPYLNEVVSNWPLSIAVHLGVFVEPYLQFVLDGKKTVESRFSVYRRPPFSCVGEGDIVLLKEAGGPVVGISTVSAVWHYNLNPESFSELRREFAAALCAQDPTFWEDRAAASFATLMRLRNVRRISPIVVEKRDRRGWVVIRRRSRQLLLWQD